jgi:hypothetical protein
LSSLRVSDKEHQQLRIFQTFFVLFIGGIVVATASGFIAGAFGNGEDMAGLLVLLVSAIIGNPIGVICAIVLNKKVLRVPGSVPLGILGAVLGVAAVILAIRFGVADHSFGLLGLALISYSPPILLGTLGYCLRAGH